MAHAGLVVVLGIGVLACGGSQVSTRPPPPSPKDFAGMQYPVPEALAAGEPQEPPPRMAAPPPVPRVEILPEADGQASGVTALAQHVKNAAVRDRETEMLVRGYFALVETLYRVSAGQPNGRDPERYDPVPLMRFHGHLIGELGQMAARAAVLQGRYQDLAAEQHVDLTGSLEAPGRHGKLRFYVRVTGCIRSDTEARMAHGANWLRAHDRGEDALRTLEPPATRFAADMQLLARTVECSRLVARALGLGS